MVSYKNKQSIQITQDYFCFFLRKTYNHGGRLRGHANYCCYCCRKEGFVSQYISLRKKKKRYELSIATTNDNTKIRGVAIDVYRKKKTYHIF